MDVMVLDQPVTPEDLLAAPGFYSARADSPAYTTLLGMTISGDAHAIGEAMTEDGVHRLAAIVGLVPNDETWAEGAVTFDEDYFTRGVLDYQDWQEKWWREAIQNSVDARSTRIDCDQQFLDEQMEPVADVNQAKFVRVTARDNGVGMDRYIVTDKFLKMGGSGKRGQPGGSTGGFGEAKKLLLFAWVSYRVETKREGSPLVIVEGHGSRWRVRESDEQRAPGTLISVVMAADQYASTNHALAYLAKCTIETARIYVSGKQVRAAIDHGQEVREVNGWRGGKIATIYYNKSIRTLISPRILVRINGLCMFDSPLPDEVRGAVFVELHGTSTEILSSSRDSIRDYDLRNAIDEFKNELAADTKSALKQRKNLVEEVYRGTGTFVAAVQVQSRIVESLRSLEVDDKGQLSDDQQKTIVEVLEQSDALAEEEVEEAREIDLRPTRGTIDALLATRCAGAVQVQTLTKIASWKPDFIVYNEDPEFRVPAKFRPEKMTPSLRKLAKFYAEICRLCLLMMNCSREYGVGWVFAADTGGMCKFGDPAWIMLNPFKNMGSQELLSLSDSADVRHIWSVAVHECTHLAFGIGRHTEEFSTALTQAIALTAPGWSQVEKIRRSVVARGKRSGESKVAQRAPDSPASSYWKAFSIALHNDLYDDRPLDKMIMIDFVAVLRTADDMLADVDKQLAVRKYDNFTPWLDREGFLEKLGAIDVTAISVAASNGSQTCIAWLKLRDTIASVVRSLTKDTAAQSPKEFSVEAPVFLALQEVWAASPRSSPLVYSFYLGSHYSQREIDAAKEAGQKASGLEINPASLHAPRAAAEDAARALEWRRAGHRGGTRVGLARARDLANGRNLSPSTVRRMSSFFARHAVDAEAEGFRPGEPGYPSPGRVAWGLWGGDAGRRFAHGIVVRERQDMARNPGRLTYDHFYRTGQQDCANVISIDDIEIDPSVPAAESARAYIDQADPAEWIERQDDFEGLDPDRCFEEWKRGWAVCATRAIEHALRERAAASDEDDEEMKTNPARRRRRRTRGELVENPPWTTKIIAKYMERIEDEAPPEWVPRLSRVEAQGNKLRASVREYGCGGYGCVFPTLDPKVVLKVTTDVSEADFAANIVDDLPHKMTVAYPMVLEVPEKKQGRPIRFLWRESARYVGEIDKWVAEHGRDAKKAEEAIHRQHESAKKAWYLIRANKDARQAMEKWVRDCFAMGEVVPELRELAKAMINNWQETGIFVSDVHAGNVGLVGDRWLIIDPGNVVSWRRKPKRRPTVSTRSR